MGADTNEKVHRPAETVPRGEGTAGQRLRRFLSYRGISIRRLAELSGISYRTLQDYLAVKAAPGGQHLKTLATFGLDIHWLLTGQLRPPIRMTFDSSDWPEIADKLGAFDPDLVGKLWEVSFEFADQFGDRWQQTEQRPLTTRESMRVFEAYYLMILRVAVKLIPLLDAVSKRPATFDDLRPLLVNAARSELDATIRTYLEQLAHHQPPPAAPKG